MGSVINLEERRREKASQILKKENAGSVLGYCTDDTIAAWNHHFNRNQISEFLVSKLPQQARPESANTASIQDLNFLAEVESRLKIDVTVLAPGFTQFNPCGWMAQLKLDEKPLSSPEMTSETYARAFVILLYLHAAMELRKLGARA